MYVLYIVCILTSSKVIINQSNIAIVIISCKFKKENIWKIRALSYATVLLRSTTHHFITSQLCYCWFVFYFFVNISPVVVFKIWCFYFSIVITCDFPHVFSLLFIHHFYFLLNSLMYISFVPVLFLLLSSMYYYLVLFLFLSIIYKYIYPHLIISFCPSLTYSSIRLPYEKFAINLCKVK